MSTRYRREKEIEQASVDTQIYKKDEKKNYGDTKSNNDEENRWISIT